MKKYIIIIFSFLLYLTSCSKFENFTESNKYEKYILGNWHLLEASQIIDNKSLTSGSLDISNQLKGDLSGSKLASQGYLLNVFSDSTYNLITNYTSEIGNWKYHNDTLLFGNNKLYVGRMGLEEYSQKTLTGKILSGGTEMDVKLFSNYIKYEKDQLDPFHPVNNQWRVKPNHNETHEEIRNRLTNYILHTALVFKSASDRQNKKVSLDYTDGALKIYKRGVGIKSIDKVNEQWERCFNNLTDARKAYFLLNAYLDNGIHRGNKKNQDWMKENYLILLRLYDQINEKTKPKEEKFAQAYDPN